MTATLSFAPKAQFFTAAGVPLSGGLLYTYAGGTTTPLATYVDYAGITQNANPVVLDSRGECALWLAQGTSYYFVLKDSLGSQIWTADNVVANGTMAAQNASAVAITGGTISGVTISGNTTGTAANVTGVVAVANGGTGQVTAALARTALSAAALGANTDITSLAVGTTINGVSIGYLGIPISAQGGAYQIVAGDQGECIRITIGGVTIPSNAALALPLGFVFSVYNNSALAQTITLTTDTMYLAGTATTGVRTLAQRGLASFLKVDTTTWVASGAGLT